MSYVACVVFVLNMYVASVIGLGTSLWCALTSARDSSPGHAPCPKGETPAALFVSKASGQERRAVWPRGAGRGEEEPVQSFLLADVYQTGI